MKLFYHLKNGLWLTPLTNFFVENNASGCLVSGFCLDGSNGAIPSEAML